MDEAQSVPFPSGCRGSSLPLRARCRRSRLRKSRRQRRSGTRAPPQKNDLAGGLILLRWFVGGQIPATGEGDQEALFDVSQLQAPSSCALFFFPFPSYTHRPFGRGRCVGRGSGAGGRIPTNSFVWEKFQIDSRPPNRTPQNGQTEAHRENDKSHAKPPD